MQLGFTHLENVAWLAFVGLAACSSASTETSAPQAAGTEESAPQPTPAGDPPSGAEALAVVDDNLQRLRDLAIFEVGDLVVELPAEATNCYGLVCPGAEDEVLAAREDAALRLADFVAAAETAAARGYTGYECIARVDANLEALRALSIVEIGSFIETEPANNPYCYNLPCPSDVDAAARENEARAAELESIALAAPEL